MEESIKIICCYARKDQEFLTELKTHLSPLQKQGLITMWADTDISAGAEWESEVDHHLDQAKIILLLVSADFIASDHCYGKEMKRAIERHKRRETQVIPIIIRHTYWKNTPLAKLQALPKNALPVASWPDRDAAFLDIVDGIQRVANDTHQILQKSITHSSVTPREKSIISSVDKDVPSQHESQVLSAGSYLVGLHQSKSESLVMLNHSTISAEGQDGEKIENFFSIAINFIKDPIQFLTKRFAYLGGNSEKAVRIDRNKFLGYFTVFAIFQCLILPILMGVLSQSGGIFLLALLVQSILIGVCFRFARNSDKWIITILMSLPSSFMLTAILLVICINLHVFWWLDVLLVIALLFLNFSVVKNQFNNIDHFWVEPH